MPTLLIDSCGSMLSGKPATATRNSGIVLPLPPLGALLGALLGARLGAALALAAGAVEADTVVAVAPPPAGAVVAAGFAVVAAATLTGAVVATGCGVTVATPPHAARSAVSAPPPTTPT